MAHLTDSCGITRRNNLRGPAVVISKQKFAACWAACYQASKFVGRGRTGPRKARLDTLRGLVAAEGGDFGKTRQKKEQLERNIPAALFHSSLSGHPSGGVAEDAGR